MPAPKNPNTAAATRAAAVLAHQRAEQRADEKAAEWLRSRGWTVTPPEAPQESETQ
jgi:hypothetical protein